MEYKMIIAGDIFPADSNKELFIKGDGERLYGREIIDLFQNADFSILNFEGSFYQMETPINKSGPVIGNTPDMINGFLCLNPSLINLANNHSLDYGIEGYRLTRKILQENKLPSIGMGDNLEEASKPYILETPIGIIGVYTCADYEFTIATEKKCGASPYDPLTSFDITEDLRKKVDYLIVIFHGGREHYRYPTPMVQRICRKFVDKGADFVVTNHTHCIGAKENYKNAEILYGQGNFLFDRVQVGDELWNTGLLVEICLEKKDKIYSNIRYIPIEKMENAIRMSNDKRILEAFYKRGEEIKQEGFLEEQYGKFVETWVIRMVEPLLGKSLIMKIIKKFLRGKYKQNPYGYIRHLYSKSQILFLLNLFRCQAHYELLVKVLNETVKEELSENR